MFTAYYLIPHFYPKENRKRTALTVLLQTYSRIFLVSEITCSVSKVAIFFATLA